MKPAPEYTLARALIAHLLQQEGMADIVLPEPWDREDQNQNLAMAAAQYGMAVAACPQQPDMVSDAATDAGYMQARVAVVILTTAQVQAASPLFLSAPVMEQAAATPMRQTEELTQWGTAAEKSAAATGLVIAACLGWGYQARGIPYAAPRLLEAAPLDTASMAGFENLIGSTLTLGWRVHYKTYYSS